MENTQEMNEAKLYWCSDKEVTCPLNQHAETAAFHCPVKTLMHGLHIDQKLKNRLLHVLPVTVCLVNQFVLINQVIYNKFRVFYGSLYLLLFDFVNVRPLSCLSSPCLFVPEML